MTDVTATTRSDGPLEETVRLSLGARLDLDVAYCDVMHARAGHDGPFDLRFRGTRVPDGMRVRFFAPLLQVEGALIAAEALRAQVRTDGFPAGDKGILSAVPLDQHALSFTKVRKANGAWSYGITVRDGAHATALADYLQALHDAAEHAAPVLTTRGYSVGAAEIISVAGELVALRTHRLTRQEHGGGNG